MPTIKTEALTHVYSRGSPFEQTALENVTMEIARGEFVGLIGRTGSGKSTFVQHLNGLLPPTGGRVLLDGADINADKKRRREARFRVGLVFQYPEYQLFEETVYRDIAFGPRNMKLSGREIGERVREAARFVGVPETLFDKSPLELSGGQKRRVAIAGVIAMRPEALILDEPTAGLDPEGCASILRNIAAYRRATGATVLLVSHSMEDVARIAERLVVFDGGHIVMDGSPAQVFSQAEALRAIGLDVPVVTEIAARLHALGVVVPACCYTVPQLRNAVLALRGGAADA
ncbi:MAG: energy-coupling factor transporter ATPase [Oscillospiraceae bacterium]|jgi:energy-coupling factor transport system ATP-binding protein|nr:energy-coupling factor transporter ATPase [Oscillospiraceae bacterium]